MTNGQKHAEHNAHNFLYILHAEYNSQISSIPRRWQFLIGYFQHHTKIHGLKTNLGYIGYINYEYQFGWYIFNSPYESYISFKFVVGFYAHVGKTRSLIYIFMSSSRPFISVDKYEIEYSYVSDDAL